MRRPVLAGLAAASVCLCTTAAPADGSDTLYFTAFQDGRRPILELIAAETVRIDVAVWWFTDREVSNAIIGRFQAGVPVRFIGDTSTLADPATKTQIDYLAAQGIPIRLRSAPASSSSIMHWKCGVFAGQRTVAFGSANWTVYSLRPYSATNYDDETILVTDNPELVPAFDMEFDQMWVDTTAFTDYANVPPALRVKLSPNVTLPSSMVWSQGLEYNTRLIRAIDAEPDFVDLVAYRLTAASVTDALARRHAAGVRVRLVIDPVQYRNAKYPAASANLDRLWALAIPIRKRTHDGITHMKTIVTSTVATNGSSNIADTWQRDHNYFIEKAFSPLLYQRLKDVVASMIANTTGFSPFTPLPPGRATLVAPANGSTGTSRLPQLVWSSAPWATSYDVWLGPTGGTMVLVGSRVTGTAMTITTTLAASTSYSWCVRARTNATARDPSLATTSVTWYFITSATTINAPPRVTLTSPASGSTFSAPANVTLTASATDSDGTIARVEFFSGSTLVGRVTMAPYSVSWQNVTAGTYTLTAVATDNSGAGARSSACTITVGASHDIVLYASRSTAQVGYWSVVSDSSAAGGYRMYNPDAGAAKVLTALAAPSHYFELRFVAEAGRAYRLWFRGKADGNSYENDSVWVQFSGARNASGAAAWQIGSTQGVALSVEQCTGCGLAGWGWHDNGWGTGVRGEPVWFAASGEQTLRVQRRQDGVSIDQIVLSPDTYYTQAPGSAKNDATILPVRSQR